MKFRSLYYVCCGIHNSMIQEGSCYRTVNSRFLYREFGAHKNIRGKAEQAIAPVLSRWSPILTLSTSQVRGVGIAKEAAGQKSTWLLVAIFAPCVDEQGTDVVASWQFSLRLFWSGLITDVCFPTHWTASRRAVVKELRIYTVKL